MDDISVYMLSVPGHTSSLNSCDFTIHCVSCTLLCVGLAYDYMKTYTIAFYASGAPPIIGAIVLFLVPQKKKVTMPTVAIAIRV